MRRSDKDMAATQTGRQLGEKQIGTNNKQKQFRQCHFQQPECSLSVVPSTKCLNCRRVDSALSGRHSVQVSCDVSGSFLTRRRARTREKQSCCLSPPSSASAAAAPFSFRRPSRRDKLSRRRRRLRWRAGRRLAACRGKRIVFESPDGGQEVRTLLRCQLLHYVNR